MKFVDLLRKPDFVYGATDVSSMRFEENDNGIDLSQDKSAMQRFPKC